MIRVTDTISLSEDEIEERFMRSSGPGGQNVNKVSTAVELRFDVRKSRSLPDAVRRRLEVLAGSRLTLDGVLVLRAEQFRTQDRNREDARARLVELIARAATPPKRRIATRMPLSAKRQRLDSKTRRSRVKSLRRPAEED